MDTPSTIAPGGPVRSRCSIRSSSGAGPLRDGSDGAIPVIRDPAAQPEPARLADDVVAEPDTLDAASDDGLEADEFVHSGGRPMPRPGEKEDVER